MDRTEFARLERSWDEEKESTTGLICSFGGKHFCALTGKSIADKDSEYAKKKCLRRLYVEAQLCVQRHNKFYPIRQEEPYKHRQGN